MNRIASGRREAPFVPRDRLRRRRPFVGPSAMGLPAAGCAHAQDEISDAPTCAGQCIEVLFNDRVIKINDAPPE